MRRPTTLNELVEEERENGVRRDKISAETIQAYQNALSVEQKCDILFHILTGEQP